nr:ABC-type oligopeptide transport system, periplasmic component [Klebsiella pneumoniae]
MPQFRLFYKGTTVKAIAPLTVRIDLGQPGKENMLSLLSLPVMPEAFWRQHKLSDPLSKPPLASGPYRISARRMGQYITYSRVADYWAADLPVNRGRWNFDTLRYDYYLDDNVAFEAFKAGAVDRREETVAKTGLPATSVATSAAATSLKMSIPIPRRRIPSGWRSIFSARFCRSPGAAGHYPAFDFEWMNKALFYSAYQRANSYFQNTEYAARSLPDAAELALLTPMKTNCPGALQPGLPAAGLPRRWLRSRQLTQSRRPAQCGGLDGEEPAPGQRRHRQAAAL